MFRKVLRAIVYLTVFIGSMFVFAGSGYAAGINLIYGNSASAPERLALPAPKAHDASKPTVAILLGTQNTEVSDFLVPYEVFSDVGAYNVYAVALERKLSTLSGGLDVLPDYSLDGLDRMLRKSPDLIVIPNIDENLPAIDPAILAWLRQHSAQGSRLLSICVGARTLAETGLLNGRAATTHWGFIDNAQKNFPAVLWQRGLRYVDDGNIVSSAGITSGIDASLHVVAQRLGLPAAQRIADDLHYSAFAFVTNPTAEQYHSSTTDSVFYVNFLFGRPRANDGVLLYNGAGEIDLASVYDTYPSSFRHIANSVAPSRDWITTKDGLRLLPRYDYGNAPSFAVLLVPGENARRLAQADVAAWTAAQASVPVNFLHANLPGHFAYDAPLQDVAQHVDMPTAQMRLRALEYRPPSLDMTGAGWPWLLTLQPMPVGLAGVLLVFAAQKMWAQRRSALPSLAMRRW